MINKHLISEIIAHFEHIPTGAQGGAIEKFVDFLTSPADNPVFVLKRFCRNRENHFGKFDGKCFE